MNYKKENKFQSLNNLEVPKSIETFMDELPNRYANGEIEKDIEDQVNREWSGFQKDLKKKNRFKQKRVIFPVSIAAACLLFIGGAFVSPAMAQIASKIPYLNLLFESKPVIDEISDALNEEGYKWDGLGVSVHPREVSVGIEGSNAYYRKVKEPVTELIQGVLDARNYDAYKIRIYKAEMPPQRDTTAEELRKSEENEKAITLTSEVLKKYGYESDKVMVYDDQIIKLQLPNNETRINEIKNDVMENVKKIGIKEFQVKVRTYDHQKEEREVRWMPIFTTIVDGLTAKQKYEVKSVGYTNKHEYFSISIDTNLSPSNKNTDDVVNEIEQTVQDFLSSDEIQKMIQGDQYEIVIYDKTGKGKLKSITSD
ncbi:hypothetical protein BAMA_18525 [Bacillus manliponensis]|uniref:DUF4179 domain-containing protein n=1 Tax=Bacillus manliponensis TaxID=574376 RepID=A0A073JS81_9BACI|nr:DUF4030 domain-containing protein [Bacillus manliponensis]KEK17117.1 hypothetical protein BAMA_18525 [Bacillus manliponensis]